MPAPLPHLEEGTHIEGGPGYHPASTQFEGESGYHPALKLLQDANQARSQLEYELIQETQKLAQRYEYKWGKTARRHASQQAQMIIQPDATSQEVFSQASLTEALKLLPWCGLCGSAFLLHKCASNHCCSTGWGHPYHIQALLYCIWAWAWASWLAGSRPLWWSNSYTRNSTSTSVFPTRYPLDRYSLGQLTIMTPRGPMSAPQKLR